MKTSNKILLSLGSLVFLSATVIDVALYTKYKKNDFITQEQLDVSENAFSKVDHFTSIEIENCGGVSLVPSDSFMVRMRKDEDERVLFSVSGDKLSVKPVNPDRHDRFYKDIVIYCPASINVELKNSDVMFRERKWKWISINMNGESRLYFDVPVDSVNLKSQDGSYTSFGNDSHIGKLTVQLDQRSEMNSDEKATIEQINPTGISDSARLQLNGKTLKSFLEKK